MNADDDVDESASLPGRSRDDGAPPPLSSSTFLLDHVGRVTLTIDSDGLYWQSLPDTGSSYDQDASVCLRLKRVPKAENELKFSETYAVELTNLGRTTRESSLPKGGGSLPGHESEMYRFSVYGVQKSKVQPSLRVQVVYTFGHMSLQICEMWVNQINSALDKEPGRPKNLLVFVHPLSGKRNGCRTWEIVAPIFSLAKVQAKVIITQRAGHAFDVMSSSFNTDLNEFDGVVAVGGDGLFNEILNGLLSSRHFPYPPTPADFFGTDEDIAGTSGKDDASFPLLQTLSRNGSGVSDLVDQDPDLSFPNNQFKFGIIPSGSTDAIVICTTGGRDPITSALHIVLGKKVSLDIAQIVRWKTTLLSKVDPCVRYAASFAGYGFYGDVITESEKFRWMGPKRYDYAGTKVFLRHRSYEAEVQYLDVKSETRSRSEGACVENKKRTLWGGRKPKRIICRANCNICSSKLYPSGKSGQFPSHTEEVRWLRSKGRFLSVGAAVISCRNERAPDGLVADAHLSDGLLDLILIKDCPHAFYLWHLTQLARKGGTPLDFDFVEHHKTPAFTFTSSCDESVWNLDGEPFQAHQLSAQVFRGLVTLFAPGPEV